MRFCRGESSVSFLEGDGWLTAFCKPSGVVISSIFSSWPLSYFQWYQSRREVPLMWHFLRKRPPIFCCCILRRSDAQLDFQIIFFLKSSLYPHSQRYLLLFTHSVGSSSLWPHGLQHIRLPCPSLFPGICSNSCTLSCPTSSSSVAPFSSCPQFPGFIATS